MNIKQIIAVAAALAITTGAHAGDTNDSVMPSSMPEMGVSTETSSKEANTSEAKDANCSKMESASSDAQASCSKMEDKEAQCSKDASCSKK